MENQDKKNSQEELNQQQKEKDLAKQSQTTGDNLINPRNAATNTEIYTNKPNSQTKAEIAEQGFTVRDGHNPNKPNPYENPISKESDLEGFDDFKDSSDELQNSSGPYKNFNETEEVLKYIDDDPEEDDVMEGDEHERNHSDKEQKK